MNNGLPTGSETGNGLINFVIIRLGPRLSLGHHQSNLLNDWKESIKRYCNL